jgi:uncharacterized protein YcbX
VSVHVTALSVCPVKGTRLRRVESVQVGVDGASGNRRFFVIDERDRMLNGKQLGGLQAVVASWDESTRRLSLSFPSGEQVSGEVGSGEVVRARFFSRQAEGRLVEGPFAGALSAWLGVAVRLVEAPGSVDRGARGAVSLVSVGSLRRLAEQAEVDEIDARRFRMLVEVDGLDPHAEDAWVGRRARIGEVLARFDGHVGRCLITGRHPDTGEPDLPTLDLLGEYRRWDDDTFTEALPFGVYGRVLEPGAIRVGDPVSVDPAPES